MTVPTAPITKARAAAVISPLPAEGGDPASGVADYTTALFSRISAAWDVTVVAQRGADPGHGPLRVRPVWSPDRRVGATIHAEVMRLGPDLVHAHHEFNLFGSVGRSLAVTAHLVRLRRSLRIPVIVTIHGVVDPDDVDPAFIARNGLPKSRRGVRLALSGAYRALNLGADRLIVHHQHFADTLSNWYGVDRGRVRVIPHGAPEPVARPDRPAGRRVIVIGFLAGYKLPEVIVEVAESDALPGATFRFCVGSNPRVADAAYRRRLAELERRVGALGSRARFDGYLPEPEFDAALLGADVLVLPYTECLASSGIAAHARGAGLRICHSRALRPIFGGGPLEFELDRVSLAAALARAFDGQDDPGQAGTFASWVDAATATEAVWDELVAPR